MNGAAFLQLMAANHKKYLIPCYKDIDAYDMPKEFAKLQAQDMGKVGAIQDLLRGIDKIFNKTASAKNTPDANITNNVPAGSNVASLLGRGYLALESGKWAEADKFFEDALNQDFQNAECYLGKLMAELQINNKDNLKNAAQPFDKLDNCITASRFDSAIAEKLKADNKFIRERNENTRLTGIYTKALKSMNSARTEANFKSAASEFESIKGHKDADEKAKECLEKAKIIRNDEIYYSAIQDMLTDRTDCYKSAVRKFESIIDWKDSREKINKCNNSLKNLEIAEEKAKAERKRKEEEARIAAEKAKAKKKKLIAIITPIIAVAVVFLIILNTVIIPRNNLKKAIAQLEAGNYDEAYSMLESLEDISELKDSIYNAASELVESGNKVKAVAFFTKIAGYKDVDSIMRNLLATTVSAGCYYTVAVKSDGTVVATEYTGNSKYLDQCDVAEWTDIVSISVGDDHAVGLKADGTVVTTQDIDVSDWSDIVSISEGGSHTVGLKANGTVVADGEKYNGECDVSDWTDIVAVSAGDDHTVGLKADGTVVAVGSNYYGQCDVSEWTDIVAISAGNFYTIGLKSDATIVATGDNDDGVYGVFERTDIVAVSAGGYHTVGLKADGTVVAVGNNDDGQCDISDWKNIKVNPYK